MEKERAKEKVKVNVMEMTMTPMRNSMESTTAREEKVARNTIRKTKKSRRNRLTLTLFHSQE